MAESRRSIQGKPSVKDLKGSKKSIVGISLEKGNGSKGDRTACRRRKSVASQFAHPMTGESLKERQVNEAQIYN